MKCIVLLSLVALCYSTPYGYGRNYFLNQGETYPHGKNIFLNQGQTYPYGKNIWLSQGQTYPYGKNIWLSQGQTYPYGKNIYVNQDGSISISTGTGRIITMSRGLQGYPVVTTTPYTQYQTGRQLFGYQPYQIDALTQIMSQYQGGLDQDTYQQLLRQVNAAVQTGQLSDVIYQALQNLQMGYPMNVGQQYGYGTVQKVVTPQGQIVEVSYYQKPYQGQQGTWGSLVGGLLRGQQVGITGQLSQIVEQEGEVLDQQVQVQQEQQQQQQQQQQLQQQQAWQLQQQQQLQRQQQYVQQLQEEQQQEQEQVLEQQKQQQYYGLKNMLGVQPYYQRQGDWQQQQGVWQQQQPMWQQGIYGYGQVIPNYVIPMAA